MGDAAHLAGAGVAATVSPPSAAAGAAVMGVFKYNFGECVSGPAPFPDLINRALYWFVGVGDLRI